MFAGVWGLQFCIAIYLQVVKRDVILYVNVTISFKLLENPGKSLLFSVENLNNDSLTVALRKVNLVWIMISILCTTELVDILMTTAIIITVFTFNLFLSLEKLRRELRFGFSHLRNSNLFLIFVIASSGHPYPFVDHIAD